MDYAELVKNTRSFRRFYQDRTISSEQLRTLIDLSRFTPSGGNRMPLKYITSVNAELNDRIFSTLGWAAYLPEWDGPAVGERPAAYIIMLRDTTIQIITGQDEGIQAQTIMLGATSYGFGGCILGNVKRAELMHILSIPVQYEVALVLAIGYPKEQVILETVTADGNLQYYRDDQAVHHVPKRSLNEVLIQER
jgi:nitroreductase